MTIDSLTMFFGAICALIAGSAIVKDTWSYPRCRIAGCVTAAICLAAGGMLLWGFYQGLKGY